MALTIAGVSLWYTNQLVESLKEEERRKAEIWAEAMKLSATAPMDDETNSAFPFSVVQANRTIPVIAAFEDGTIVAHRNLDSLKVDDPKYLEEMLARMKAENPPITVEFLDGERISIYYEHSILLSKLQLYPLVQLSVIGLFLLLSYVAFSYSRKSEQNQVWVGMSKETAHQLGTPISSLMAWMEILKTENQVDDSTMEEIGKDIERLELITDRFSKIGSEPILQEEVLADITRNTVDYLKTRTSDRVEFQLVDHTNGAKAKLNEPLFAWVIENITKNAIDAMSGSGKLLFEISETDNKQILEITDNGKGIPSSNFKTIFKPGFTTKKRGWGLGLSLVKRIVENYHKGEIFVKESIPNVKTTFRIVLKS
jgi:two-component system, sporulation sensor kinase D